VKGHLPKSVPDRVLKGMILQTMLKAQEGLDTQLTSKEIHSVISNHQAGFFFESPETDKYGKPLFAGEYTYDNLPGVRSALSYLKGAGYVSLYDRDRWGDLIRLQQTQPYVWYLTPEGEIHANDTFYKLRHRLDIIEREIDEKVQHRLSNDEQVSYLADQKRIEMCKTCRDSKPPRQRLKARANTVRPNRGKIGIQVKDDTIKEIEVTPEGDIKELEDLKKALVMKNGNVDVASTILNLQNTIEAQGKLLGKAGIEIGKLDTQLIKEKGRKTARSKKESIRKMGRLELAQYY